MNTPLGKVLLATLFSILLRAKAQSPLVEKHYDYPDGIPYKVDTDTGPRGTQTGFNRCNSTTLNQDSLCQTSFINSVDDFCLWGGIKPDSLVGDVEGEMVAWCTQPNHGSRVIPAGTLKGVQFMRTPDYVQVVGYIDQVNINIKKEDTGGEMDPHGADLRGNPLGALMYSNAWTSDKTKYTQVIEWHNFLGSDFFCLKACDPSKPNGPRLCEHIYDRIGCAYNAPNNAKQGVFESCEGENQDPPGVYTSNGAVMTYQQPPESLGPITSIPYTARVPASSNCATYTSADIYKAEETVKPAGASSTTGTPARSGTVLRSGSAAAASSTANSAVSGGGATVNISMALGLILSFYTFVSALFLGDC